MEKLVLFMHVSLDGFVAGPGGEMDWIHVDEEIFDFGAERITKTNTALYGRVTFQMMEGYWPTAAEQPGATKHDREHATWYNSVHKVVLSNTLKQETLTNTTVIGQNYTDDIRSLKRKATTEILLFGSPTAAHSLLAEKLIDECWLFVNPVLLAEGIPLFKDVNGKQPLKLLQTHVFSSGVVCLRHEFQHTIQ